MSIGFAGGFNDENVEARLRALVQAYGTSDISIDAEGGLRAPVTPNPWDDELVLEKALAYLDGASRGFQGAR